MKDCENGLPAESVAHMIPNSRILLIGDWGVGLPSFQQSELFQVGYVYVVGGSVVGKIS